jgi:hypothetical protein
MQMNEVRIPESIKERLRKRLEESVMKKDVVGVSERRMRLSESLRERLRKRLRARMLESKDSLRDRIRAKLRAKIRERLFEGSSGVRERIRGRLLESRGGLRAMLRERIRQRLIERRVGSSLVRSRLAENLREKIRQRIRERLLEGRNVMRSMRGVVRSRVVGDEIGLGERRLVGLRRAALRERLARLSDRGVISGRSGMGESFLRRRVERLERELERKKRLLKEAYKVVRRVEELGGIDKIEKAMRLAYDTIVKAGSKAFKEAVEALAGETGVDKKEVAMVVKKVGLKEAREILKRGKKGKAVAKTIIVEGMGEKKEQVPVLAMRVAERLSKQVEVGNPSDIKDLSEAVFRK